MTITLSSHPLERQAGPQGQALVEFLGLAVALIPLFLLVPMLAKYQDIGHATQMASRYAAFDATTRNDMQGTAGWKPEAQLADEVRRRFFSNADAPVKTDDVAGDFDANRNLFWRDPYGHPLVKKFSDVTVSYGSAASTAPNHAAGFSGSRDGQPFLLESPLQLSSRGTYGANVSVSLANLAGGLDLVEPFDRLNLTVQRHTSLLIEPWSAMSPQQAESRFGQLAPVNAPLAALEPLIAVAILPVDLGRVSAPRFGNLQAWRDVVPADRLRRPD